MGRKTAKLEVFARLSNNHSDDDERDQEAWEKFTAEVRELVARPEYADLEIDVSDAGTW